MRYRVEQFLVAFGGWALVVQSDDYAAVDAVASDLLAVGARGVRIVDTARDPERDAVVWEVTR